MRVLYDSAQVQKAIKSIFKSSRGRRVAITAFVGKHASAYLPNPDGIELVCWPKAGGTNPSAIRDLIARKVKVRFADALHMKLYWTADRGAVVTSANLSTHAMGSGGLREMGVWIPSSAINIDKVLKSINAREVRGSELDKLDAAHLAYSKVNFMQRATSKANSYAKWYSSTPRSKWKIAWFYDHTVHLSRKARGLLEREHGSAQYSDLLGTAEGYANENDWLLCFNVDGKQPRWIVWMFAHHVVSVPPSDKRAYAPDMGVQVIQVYPLHTYSEPPPFSIDSKFKRALKNAVRDFGGLKAIMDLDSPRPPKRLIDSIFKHYA